MPLRHNSRPDDGPVQGPKHVVLVINTPLPYYFVLTVLSCTILLLLIIIRRINSVQTAVGAVMRCVDWLLFIQS